MKEQTNNGTEAAQAFFCIAISDARLRPMHLSLYFALFQLWLKNGCKNPIPITRNILMKNSKIRSIVSYHKCISELCEYGYLDYSPSYHPALGSTISLLKIE